MSIVHVMYGYDTFRQLVVSHWFIEFRQQSLCYVIINILMYTVSQFNPVTWSAKPGARSPPIAAESLAAPPAGMVKKSTIADDKIKPPNPHSKGQVQQESASLLCSFLDVELFSYSNSLNSMH